MRWNDRIGRRIKLSDLHVLLAVAQAGSMAKAASQLAISHPAISRSISTLEHALGVRLLERSPRGIELTTYGRAMLSRSSAAFDELRQGVKQIEFLADPGVGEVRVGSTHPLAASFVSTIVDRLYRRHPRMMFHVATSISDELLRELEERNLDLLVLRKSGTMAEEEMTFDVLYDNPYFVAAGARNPLTRRRCIELAELVDEPWVLPPADTRFGLLANDIFKARGLARPRAVVTATSVETVNNLLRMGRYLAIHPESVFTFPAIHPFVKKLAVELPSVGGPIGIVTMKNRMLSPAAQLFIDVARDIAKPLASKSGRRNVR
jgi:DNA-binding transcriptional LysR family regulator